MLNCNPFNDNKIWGEVVFFWPKKELWWSSVVVAWHLVHSWKGSLRTLLPACHGCKLCLLTTHGLNKWIFLQLDRMQIDNLWWVSGPFNDKHRFHFQYDVEEKSLYQYLEEYILGVKPIWWTFKYKQICNKIVRKYLSADSWLSPTLKSSKLNSSCRWLL